MPIKDSEYFSYAGIASYDYGIRNVNVEESGMAVESLTPGRSTVKETIRGRSRPYFYSIEYTPRLISVSFAFEEPWNNDRIREIVRWLCGQGYYQPLFFDQDVNRIYYALVVDEPQLVHDYLSSGYINLTFECSDYYAYTSVYETSYDFSGGGTNPIVFENEGDVDCYPLLTIKNLQTEGNISIKNANDGNREFRFDRLDNNETVTVHNEEQIITTDKPLTYRYSDFNNNYLRLLRGVNHLSVEGKCTIDMKYQFKLI